MTVKVENQTPMIKLEGGDFFGDLTGPNMSYLNAKCENVEIARLIFGAGNEWPRADDGRKPLAAIVRRDGALRLELLE